jgi:hypothetical protein
MMIRLLVTLLMLVVAGWPAAIAQAPGGPVGAAAPPAELWSPPDDLADRDFFNGPWGAARAPDPAAVYTFVAPKTGGINPGMTVRDPEGRQWKVKQAPLTGRGAEGPIEVVLSRVLSGVGYRQPPVYYLPSFLLARQHGAERVGGGRFRLSMKGLKERGSWSWMDNPYTGSRPLNGLLVILLMFNSSDLKDSNNSLYDYTAPGAEHPTRWFVVRDIGTALGSTGRLAPLRGNLAAFERLGFIKGVADGYVQFHYSGLHQELFTRRITPGDVYWAAQLMARVSDTQWADAFRAGGYTPDVTGRFVAKLKSKIDDGLAFEPTERP